MEKEHSKLYAKSIQPLVSVMMPVYNGEKKLPVALASLEAQTYPNWKAIIVNDGSTDGTKKFLDSLKGEKYKVIHLKKNQGRGNARQVALESAEGKYLAFLDADDFYHPKKLEEQVSIFEKYKNVEVVSTGIGSFDLKKNLKSIRGIEGSGKVRKLNNKFLEHPFFPASCMLKTKRGQEVKYNQKLNVGEDNDFLRKYFEKGIFYKIEDVLYYYEEIGAINLKKLLNYQLEIIKTLIIIEDFSWMVKVREMVKRIFKIIFYVFSIPVLGVDAIVTKRGQKPLKEHFSMFNEVKKKLIIEDI